MPILIAVVPVSAFADITGPARVIDGDTIEVQGQRIRLHGIGAPEGRQLCFDVGRGQLQRLLTHESGSFREVKRTEGERRPPLHQSHDNGEAFMVEREDEIDSFLLGLLACLREMPSPGKLRGLHLHYTHEETCSVLDLRGVRGVRARRLRRREPRSTRARPTAPGGVVP